MKAIVYDAPRKFEYRDVDSPRIQSDEVLIRVDACGLCGTDLHIHEGELHPVSRSSLAMNLRARLRTWARR